MSKLLHESPNLVIAFEPAHALIYANWLGAQDEAAIRGGGAAMLEAMRAMHQAHGCTKVLNDNRQVEGVWGHSVDWAAKEWLPAMVDAGLSSFAWILSKMALVNMSGVRMRIRVDANATELMATFPDEDSARAWLASRVD
jgi:hypothetical protein